MKVYSIEDCKKNIGRRVEIVVYDCFAGIVKVIKVKGDEVLIKIIKAYACYSCQPDPKPGKRYWIEDKYICKNW